MRLLLATALCAGFAMDAQGGSISFTGTQIDLDGTGFGNVLNVLSLQNNRSEFGSVLWNGAADVLTDDATNTSKTRTASELLANGVSGAKFAVYFNGNEPGNASSVLLHDFKMHFLGADGSVLFDTLFSAPPGGLSLSDFGGTGRAGWVFEVALSDDEAALFFGNGGNRIGMSITADQAIGDVAGGAENFFIGRSNDGPTGGGEPTPEPSSVAVWTLVALAVVLKAKRRSQPV